MEQMQKEGQRTIKREFSADELIEVARRILEIKEKVMRENLHYGIIPGCSKPSLWKPGAEKLCAAFRLRPEFATTLHEDPQRTIKWEEWDEDEKQKEEGLTRGFFEYDSKCTLVHIPTGEVWAKNVSGTCNNFESHYRSFDPHDVKNTVEKMSEKRSLVAAVLIGTGASDIFTQDVEDVPDLVSGQAGGGKAGERGGNTREKNGREDVRMATRKQVGYIKSQIEKKGISERAFFKEWAEEFDSWDGIPFNIVNDILEWIRGK